MIEAALEIHWQRTRRHFLRDRSRVWALECVHSPIPSLVICPKGSVCGRDGNTRGLLTTGHARANLLQKGPDARRGEPQSHLRVFCHWVSNASPMGSSGGSQVSSPRAPGRRERYLGGGKGNTLAEPAFFYFPTGLKANPTSSKETMRETTALGPKVYLLTPIAQQLPFFT